MNTAQFNPYDYSGNNPVTWSDPSGLDFWGDMWTGLKAAGKEVGSFWDDYKATIIGIGAGALATAGCLAVAAGAGSVGCFVLAGAVSNVWRTQVQKKEEFSWGGLARETALGGALGLLGPVAGAVARAVAPAARAAVSAVARPAQSALSRVTTRPTPSAASPAFRVQPTSSGRVSASCGVANSFVAGTGVALANGASVPIEEIQLGDEVLSSNPTSGEVSDGTVIGLTTGTGVKTIVTFVVQNVQGIRSVFEATSGHPIWVETVGWVDAGDLQPGDLARTADGALAEVVETRRVERTQQVFNLTIADTHTYYISAANLDIPTHNQNCGGSGDLKRDALGRFASGAGGETSATAAGRSAHVNYSNTLGGGYEFNRAISGSNKRPDAINWETRTVRELKPDTSSEISRGLRQLQGYREELKALTGDEWTGVLDLYKR